MVKYAVVLLTVLLLAGCGPDLDATRSAESREFARIAEEHAFAHGRLIDLCTIAVQESIYVSHERTNKTILAHVGPLASGDYFRLYYQRRGKQHPHQPTFWRATSLLQQHRKAGTLGRHHPSTYCLDFARPTPVP